MNLAIYKELSDDTLVTLASIGDVRRAKKDLERNPLQVQEERADAITLAIPNEGISVTLPSVGPTKAICT
jgi:acyl-CoA hydrolase